MSTLAYPALAHPLPAAPRKTTRDTARLRPVEPEPITLSAFKHGDIALRFKHPAAFTPVLDASGQVWIIENKRLGVSVFANTGAALARELKAELAFLWEEYALADDIGLTADAHALKQNLLATLEASHG
jgi:hypothetical protein